MTRELLMVALLGLAVACKESSEPRAHLAVENVQPAYPTLLLKTYQVRPDQEKLVERLISTAAFPVQVTSAAGTQTQFVHPEAQFTGDGYFVLNAPERTHEGVKQLLEELKTRPAVPAQRTIEVTYWLVLGYPNKDPQVPDRLTELAPALGALSNLGPMRFELLERLQMQALTGEHTKTIGEASEVEQTASIDKDVVELKINVTAHGKASNGRVETTMNIKAGQFAVFGQSGYEPRDGNLANGKPTLFYFVRAKPAT